MGFLGQGEGALFVEIREGMLVREPEIFSADVVPHVAVATHAARIFSPPRDRAAADADRWRACQRFNDAKRVPPADRGVRTVRIWGEIR